MLVMRFLMSLGCWWCFFTFTGNPPHTLLDLRTRPGLAGLSKAPELAKPGMAVTCVAQSHCSPEHQGVLRRWPLVSLEAAGQAVSEMRQRSHPGHGTHICSGTQGGSVNLPVIAIPIIAISMNKPLFDARCFIVSQSKDMPEANSPLLKPPLCCNRRCCWGLGSGNFLVTCLFVLDYSILLPRCISELLPAAGALVNSPDELKLCSLEKVGFVENLLICHCPLGEVHAYSSVITWGCTALQHSYWQKRKVGVFFTVLF